MSGTKKLLLSPYLVVLMKLIIQLLLITGLILGLAWCIQWVGISPHIGTSEEAYTFDRCLYFGDSLHWAQADYQDKHWHKRLFQDTNAVFWIREKIELTPQIKKQQQTIGLVLEFLASYELFWDGQLIGVNGKIGLDKTSEIEGQYFQVFPIPDSLSGEGVHVIALRSSNFHLPDKIRHFSVRAGVMTKQIKSPLIFTAFIHILAGVFLIISIYYLVIYFGRLRELSTLFFGLLCLVFLALILIEYMKFYYWYPYSFHYTRLAIVEYLTMIFALLLLLFILFKFEVPGKMAIILPFFGFIFLTKINVLYPYGGHDSRLQLMSLIAFYTAFTIALWAYFEKKDAAAVLLLGITPCLFIFFYYDLILFLGFSNLVLFNLYALSKQQNFLRQQQQEALLRSLRLEAELLKKNLQPHYLMNTLTSLIEWIEKDPTAGANFVDALATEFKILNRISGQDHIPIQQEVALCQSHLRIMSFRKGRTYTLHTEGLVETQTIPPAIIHTLIENGITHYKGPLQELLFELSFSTTESYVEYRLVAPLPDSSSSHSTQKLKDGTGFKYIKARLEETYPGGWSFKSMPETGAWVSVVQIHHHD